MIKKDELKMMKKIGFGLVIILVALGIVGLVFGDVGSGSEGGMTPLGGGSEGGGIYRDSKTGELTTDPGEENTLASTEDLMLNPNFVIENQDIATKEQMDGFSNKRLEKEFGLKSSGPSSNGEWKDLDNFEYEGTRIDSRVGESFEKADFKTDGKVEFTYKEGKGTLLVDNNQVIAGSSLEVGPASQQMAAQAANAMGGCADGSCSPSGMSSGGGGSAGGGSGGGEGGSGLTPGIDSKLQSAFQAWGQISGILGEMKGLFSNEGNSQSTSGVGESQIALDNGAQAYLTEEEKEALLAQYDVGGEESVTTVSEGLGQLESSDNTQVVIPEQAVVSIPTGTPTTTITNEGNSEDIYSVAATEQAAGITAAVISDLDNQYVKLVQQNLGVGGEKLIVDLLKSFKEVNTDGRNLKIRNGKTNIIFNGKQTFYERRIKETPHNMYKITNKLDLENYFKLRNYEDENNYLIDGKKVVSVGNKAVPHPKERGLYIAEVRKEMWLKG